MGFQLAEFVDKRPVAYHVTRRGNLPHIRESGALYSAGRLLALAGRTDLLRSQRRGDLTLQVGAHSVVVRDQDPLVLGSLSLAPGITLHDYIEYLNRWIYFWPGDWRAPAGRAKGLAAASGESDFAMIRVAVRELFSANSGTTPCFAPANSGAARHNSGKPAERDLKMHRRAGIFREKSKDVVEVVVEDEALLPGSAEVAYSLSGPWHVLRAS